MLGREAVEEQVSRGGGGVGGKGYWVRIGGLFSGRRRNELLGVDLAAAALRKRGGGAWRLVWTGDKAERGRVVAGSM